MATLSEILSDPKALEAIFRGLIGAGTAAAGIQQATTPQTTTVTRGTPGAPSPMETEALGLGFGGVASQFPSVGLTRTPTGLSYQPTAAEQESVLGLNRAMRALQSRIGGGPVSTQGPADAMTNAALTRRPAFDRSRLIGAIRAKMGGQVGSSGTIDMTRGPDGSFSVPTANGSIFNIPSSAVDFPGSTPGAPGQPRASTSGTGGLGSALGIGTGVLGAGAGILQVLKTLGIVGPTKTPTGTPGPNVGTQGAFTGAGGDVASLTEALVNSGMTPADASSLIQQVLAEDATELANIGQFDPNTFTSFINPSEVASESVLGLGAGEVADPVLESLGLSSLLPAGLGVFGAGAGAISGLVSFIRAMRGPGGQPHWYDKAYEQTTPGIEAAARDTFKSVGDSITSFNTNVFASDVGLTQEEAAYLVPFKNILEAQHTNNIIETVAEALLWGNTPTPEEAAQFVVKVLGKVPPGLEQALATSKASYNPDLAKSGRDRFQSWLNKMAEQDRLDRLPDDSGE